MRQDRDVARVTAAMNAPGFKYRSFGNEPVRIRPGAAGTLAQPPAEPAGFVDEPTPAAPAYPTESFPAEPPAPEPRVPEPLAYEDTVGAHFAYDSFPEPTPEPTPPMQPPPPLMVEPAPVAPEPPPAAPLFSWPETPASPTPAPMAPAAPAFQPEAPIFAPAPERAPQPLSAGGFRLLESMGHRPSEAAPPRLDAAPGGTMGLLRRAAESGSTGGSTMAGIGFGSPNPGPMPPLSPSGHQSGLLPAAAVTVPLSDVMRLIAAGATPPPSPFDAFRAALVAQPGR